MKINYLAYFKTEDGQREGVEVIEASSREEAEKIYRRYFNVEGPCKVIPRIEVVKTDDQK